jgi:Transcriptional regulator/sugar kinase
MWGRWGACFGAGRGFDPLFYMTLSTGIGGGIVSGGEILRGADSYAGEIGHLTIRPEGPECLCGSQGCFERMCCGLWLGRDHGRTAAELMSDPSFVQRYVVDLALGLKACVMLLNPARIVIGGGISKAGDKLFTPLRAELRRQITPWSRARLDVTPAELGDDSVLYGALALARAGEQFMNFAEQYKRELLAAIDEIDLEQVHQAIDLFKNARSEASMSSCAAMAAALPPPRTSPATW